MIREGRSPDLPIERLPRPALDECAAPLQPNGDLMSRLRRWSGKGLRVLAIAAPLAAVSSCGGSVEKGKEQDSVSGLEGELAMQAGVALDGSRFVRHALRTPDGREIELEFEQAPDLRAG